MTDLELAIGIFRSEGSSFVLVKHGRTLARGSRDGIGELLAAAETLGEAARGSSLADKVVGKAVAMVAAHYGLSAVFSPLASEPAQQVLARHGIELQPERLVPLILNRRNDGPCPMERLTMPLEQPGEAVAALKEFVAARNSTTRNFMRKCCRNEYRGVI
jgi:Domain of unknown function (DUF1893)